MLGMTHRAFHTVPFLWYLHKSHHDEVNADYGNRPQWTAILLWTDSWKTTIDLWLIEYIPTAFYCWIFGCWWIAVMYYFWVAFVQDFIDHNPRFNLYPLLSSGKYHMQHHKNYKINYATMFPWSDWIMGTCKGGKNGR